MEQFHLIRYIIAGTLRRDFIITAQGKSYFDIPGGSIPYAASGFGMWETGLGLIGCVGENYPQEWIERLGSHGFDPRGISILPKTIDLRSFIFYLENQRFESRNPIAQFSQLGIEIPKSLLGFIPANQRNSADVEDQAIPMSIQQIPSDYLDATAAHIGPLDTYNQNLLLSHLHGKINTISLDPPKSHMKASAWESLPEILGKIHILQLSEEKIRALFRGRSNDIWEMIEALSAYGLEIIVVKREKEGQYVYDSYSKQKWVIPAYPARIVDTTGCGDAFCGGFMTGYRKTYDPVEAALHGNISSSFSIEGTGAFYSLDVLPGLAVARLVKLREMVKKI